MTKKSYAKKALPAIPDRLGPLGDGTKECRDLFVFLQRYENGEERVMYYLVNSIYYPCVARDLEGVFGLWEPARGTSMKTGRPFRVCRFSMAEEVCAGNGEMEFPPSMRDEMGSKANRIVKIIKREVIQGQVGMRQAQERLEEIRGTH